MFLADGFEDVEALATRDVLLRGGVEVVTASIKENKEVYSSHKITILSDININQIKEDDYDFLILPGGGKGTFNLRKSPEVKNIVNNFYNENKLIGAICAAPTLLGDLNLLKGKKYTCYAGCNKEIKEGIFTSSEVEISGLIITARSMNYSVLFGLTILEKLTSLDNRMMVEKQIRGLDEK